VPSFIFTRAVLAGATFNPLVGWQYQYLPWPAKVSVLARATAIAMVNVYTSGSETIVEESPTQAGGTAGVTPAPLNTPEQNWLGAAGDLLKLNYRNTSGATITIDGIIDIVPL